MTAFADSDVVEAEARQDLIGRRRVGDEPRGEAEDANGDLRVDGTNPIGDHHPDPAVAHPVLKRDHRRVARRIDDHLGVERRTAAGIPQRDIDAAASRSSAAATSLPMAMMSTLAGGGADPPSGDAAADFVLGDVPGPAPRIATGWKRTGKGCQTVTPHACADALVGDNTERAESMSQGRSNRHVA